MRIGPIVFICLILSHCGILAAEETDQYTLPPGELSDFGPIASNRLYAIIAQAKNQTNAEIQMLIPKAQNSAWAASKLAERLNGDYIAHLIYSSCGPGFPRWLRQEKASTEALPNQYREVLPWKTIYWLVFSQSPLSLIGLTPTIRMYDYYFGTDKMGHFFAQGNTYYKIYRYYLAHHKTAQQAHAAILTYGQILERTYLGTLVNGIYSNADLSANYAGFKFYLNLTEEITLGEQKIPPILILQNHAWQFTATVDPDTLFKTYLSDNLNEAWNPSYYSFNRGQIRKQVKKRCAGWITRKGITPELVQAKLEETSLWHGEEYGHWLPQDYEVTLKTCFDDF